MLKDSTQALLRPAQAFPSPSPTVSSNNGAPTPLGFLVFPSGPVCTGAGTPVPGFSEGSCVDRLRSTKTTARKGHHPPHWCPHRPHPRWSQQADGPRPFPSPLARSTMLVWSASPLLPFLPLVPTIVLLCWPPSFSPKEPRCSRFRVFARAVPSAWKAFPHGLLQASSLVAFRCQLSWHLLGTPSWHLPPGAFVTWSTICHNVSVVVISCLSARTHTGDRELSPWLPSV